jgi:nitrogenase molybdenum-iron protein alpha/beta subunit
MSVDKWQPCHGYCQMTGAASALLSIKGAGVVLNGPRWCAVLAERELSACVKEHENRLFCSEIQEFDLLYGTGEVLTTTVDEVQRVSSPTLLGVLTSCSMSLIGDDIAGICKHSRVKCPTVVLDAGGFTGEFWSGYSVAMIGVLNEIELNKYDYKISNRVNLLGISTCYPNWEGDLLEIKRILSLAGYEIGVCLGADNVSLEEIRTLPLASLNIVLAPELGEKIAVFLEKHIEQNYIINSMPYGFRQTINWLKKIGKVLGIKPDVEKIELEIAIAQTDILDEFFNLKAVSPQLYFERAVISAPFSTAYGLSHALLQEVPNIKTIYMRVHGPNVKEWLPYGLEEEKFSVENQVKNNILFWNKRDELPKLPVDSMQILAGTERERTEIGQCEHTIFENVFMPAHHIKPAALGYGGVRGWQIFLKDIFRQMRTLLIISNKQYYL